MKMKMRVQKKERVNEQKQNFKLREKRGSCNTSNKLA